MRKLLSLTLLLLTLSSFAQNKGYEKGELIVQFNENTDPYLFVREFESDQNLKVSGLEELSDIVNIYQITFLNENIDLNKTQRLLQTYKEIKIVQKNHFVTNRESIPNDLFFGELWHLKNDGTTGGTIDADIDATDAWDITTGGLTTHNDTIVVCIIEGGGADIDHIELQENMWKNHGEIPDDGIDNDENGYIDDYDGWNVLDDNDDVGSGSHGTRVCGMIGAKGNNDFGISGVNWNVKMMMIKGQQASNEASVIAAYSYPLKMRKLYNETFGEKGAFVVVTNSSWGIDNGDPEESPLWCAMYDSLGTYGILSVGAVTNDDENVEETGDLPTNCTSDYFIGVTMTNRNDNRASAGYGFVSVDLAAPGFGLRLTSPGDSFMTTSGTSFAAPCVSASIALAYSAPCPTFINDVKFDPSGAALQMRQYILNGVDALDALSTDVATGGRLNVNNTIALMLEDCDTDACITPYNINITAISDTAATISWDGFTSDYKITFRKVGETASVTDITSNVITIDTLTACTDYIISIQSDCGGSEGLSVPSFEYTFTSDGCCKNPPLTNPEKTDASLTIAWIDVLYATDYNFRYSLKDSSDWTEITGVTSPLLIESLEKCSEYELQIYTLCGDSTRGYSESSIFKTRGCGACTELEYCPIEGANDSFEWIDSVSINGFANQTGRSNGWLQSEQIITALTPGESYEIRIRPDFESGTFSERYSVYIDFNQNGDFDMPEEAVVLDYLTSGTAVRNIDIPLDAPVGVTKIRIGMAGLVAPVPCPDFVLYGEYEDYCVYIGNQVGITENEFNFSVFPNPAQTSIYVKGDVPIEYVRIYSNDGKEVIALSQYDENPIDINQLSTGIYILRIETNQGVYTKKFVKQ